MSWFVLFFCFIGTSHGFPFPQFDYVVDEIQDFLTNITVNDISHILRQIPLPNPIIFDGLPLAHGDVSYYLYTRDNQDVPIALKRSNMKKFLQDQDIEVKFIVHGWLESANSSYYRGFIDAYLTRGDYYIIGVDWSRPSRNEYTIAARNTRNVGRDLGDFIIRMTKLTTIPLKNIHILGHSLGAHVAGFAGKEVLSRTSRRIGRISALDAAGPLFETPVPVEEHNRLNPEDADFVDCIHTDGGIFGMTKPIGHADFFPNGGIPRQPGCSNINIRDLSTRVIIDDMFCSHTRSHEIYTESINSDRFKAVECNSYYNFRSGRCRGNKVVILGEDIEHSTRGTFYLYTNSEKPFARS